MYVDVFPFAHEREVRDLDAVLDGIEVDDPDESAEKLAEGNQHDHRPHAQAESSAGLERMDGAGDEGLVPEVGYNQADEPRRVVQLNPGRRKNREIIVRTTRACSSASTSTTVCLRGWCCCI